MKTNNVKLPAKWASALINGDYSGCSDAEEKEINEWLRNNPHYGPCMGCSDYPELRQFEGLLTECLEFTFPAILTRQAENSLTYLVWPCLQHEKPLPWQKMGLSYTATGYGKKIPTSRVLYLFGRMYRIYCTIYSNAGTCWIDMGGKRVIVE